MSNLTVRQAVLDDINALSTLFDSYRQFYGCASDLNAAREFLLARFNRSESIIFIAEDAGTAIGFTQLYPSFSSASLARVFILNDIFVDENCRRKGAANLLLTAAIKFARSLGAIRLTLSTEISNETAQALYSAAGWKRDQKFLVFHYTLQV